MSRLRSPAVWTAIVLVLMAACTWCFSPAIRLALHEGHPARPAATTVNAHLYDAEWFDAARAGRTDILGALLDAGYPINAKTDAGYTAVILAAYNGQPLAVEFLLKHRANGCLGDRNGNTALMGALYKGELIVADRLLRADCPVDEANHAGETALSFAVMFGRLGFIHALVAAGADPLHRDGQGDTAFAVARKQGNAESLKALASAASEVHGKADDRPFAH